ECAGGMEIAGHRSSRYPPCFFRPHAVMALQAACQIFGLHAGPTTHIPSVKMPQKATSNTGPCAWLAAGSNSVRVAHSNPAPYSKFRAAHIRGERRRILNVGTPEQVIALPVVKNWDRRQDGGSCNCPRCDRGLRCFLLFQSANCEWRASRPGN